MPIEKICKRQISKRMKLTKTVKEIYKHSNLKLLSSTLDFSKPILLVTREILNNFSTILLCKDFHFVICFSLDLQEEKRFKKLNANLIFIKVDFISEIQDKILGDSEIQEKSLLNHLIHLYPQGSFDILSESNLKKYVENTPFKDILIKNDAVVPFADLLDSNEGETIYNPESFTEYCDNLEFQHSAGIISKGTLMISDLNPFKGLVLEKDRSFAVEGANINRAMHGDEVYVDNNKVVGIFKAKTRVLVGTLFKLLKFNNLFYGVVRPIDRRLSDIYVITNLDESYLNTKVVVHVMEWKVNEKLPRGVIFNILGKSGDFEVELVAIQEHFDMDYRNETWQQSLSRHRANNESKNAYKNNNNFDFNKLNGNPSPIELGLDPDLFTIKRAQDEIEEGKRKDLRHLNVCSIDPKGCTDIDDALHCVKHVDFIEIGVHIADVSFYVTENSDLDLEAKSRSTTVYFPEKRIDMLPPFLSSDLCSLKENQDRATFSCIWRFDFDYNVISHEITKSIIRSRAALSYEEADQIIKNGKFASKDVPLSMKESLDLLDKVSKKLRDDRFNNGALELNHQEIYVEKGIVKVKESVSTHHLVEEFMLLANITVAKFIYDHNPEYSVLRKHPLPSTICIDGIDCSSSKALNDSLKNLEKADSADCDVKADRVLITKRIITRSMQQAIYFCSGESSDFYHYGLAIPIYTHFTSPIRRYPDILVHRTLNYILKGDEDSLDLLKQYVNHSTCSKMNYRHRNAQNARRLADSLYISKAINCSENVDDVAAVVSVTKDGVNVFIKKYGIEAFVKTSEKYEVFDTLKVKIDKSFEKFCKNRVFDVYE